MIVVLQRVARASVEVEGRTVGSVGLGLLALVAVERDDGEAEADWCARKVAEVRLFPDEAGKMNRSLHDVGGGVLAVSQFTLAGELDKGTRPSFGRAARPEVALPLFERFRRGLEERGLPVATGVFQATMAVELVNDGPVTLILRRRPKEGGWNKSEGALVSD